MINMIDWLKGKKPKCDGAEQDEFDVYLERLESEEPDPNQPRDKYDPFDWCDDLPVTNAEMIKAYIDGDIDAVAAYAQWLEHDQGAKEISNRYDADKKAIESGRQGGKISGLRKQVDAAKKFAGLQDMANEAWEKDPSISKIDMARHVVKSQMKHEAGYLSDDEEDEYMKDGRLKYVAEKLKRP